MARSSKATKPSPTKPRTAPPAGEDLPASNIWLDDLAGFWLRFEKFGWDVLGVGLLAGALLTVLGMLRLTQGAWLSSWVTVLTRGLGWGRYSIPLVLALLGLLALRRHFDHAPTIRLGRVLALEGALFALLALLAVLGGLALDRAQAGMDGGLVGWGLATLVERLIPYPFSIALLAVLLAYFLLSGLGVFGWLAKWIERQAADRGDEIAADLETPESAVVFSSPDALKSSAQPKPDEKPASCGAAPAFRRDDRLPPLNLFTREQAERPDQQQIHTNAALLEKTLLEFGVPARVAGYRIGPTVTQYAVEPGFVEKTGPEGEPIRQKVRVSQISALARDLALALSAERLRIEAPVPGQSFVGVEVPNSRSTIVRLRPILESEPFNRLGSPLAMALGQDVSGQPVVADLARMPHILIAGTTGSGKSVCIAALTACLMANNTPDDLRIAMLDPKMVELVRFNGLPHLLGKVETGIDRMLAVLRWTLMEMDNRYRLLEATHSRDLETYNRKMERRKQAVLPRIVLLIDELADLMMSAPEQTEHSLVRLAQMARATGIHLVVATQRPSTDVVTGLIKANFPARISFTVASSVDSRVILDVNGAETLLGRGDMLFLNPESGTPVRAQGVLVTDQEVEKVVGFWKKMSPPDAQAAAPWEEMVGEGEENGDKLVEQATQIVRKAQRASASMLQRRLRIGYPRAARLMDELEELGVVGPAQGGGREREVLIDPEEGDEDEEAYDADDRYSR